MLFTPVQDSPIHSVRQADGYLVDKYKKFFDSCYRIPMEFDFEHVNRAWTRSKWAQDGSLYESPKYLFLEL